MKSRIIFALAAPAIAGALALGVASIALLLSGHSPIETFRSNIWVAPFYEDDLKQLAELIGVDRVLMGSDWPHPEGNIMPGDFADSIQKLPEADIKKIMRDNLLALLA